MIQLAEKKITDFINAESLNCHEILSTSPEYPFLLKNIKKSPKILYAKGNLDILNKSAVAIVGTRKPTKEGTKAAKKIAKYYAENGFNIVSGLALGVDSIAMNAALSNNTQVIGVLPSSLDNIIPKSNLGLAKKILENNGLLITEYSKDTNVQKYHYINRNRIISGISILTVIVETSVKGGTMHTFNFAKEQRRPIIVADLPSEGNLLLKGQSIPTFNII